MGKIIHGVRSQGSDYSGDHGALLTQRGFFLGTFWGGGNILDTELSTGYTGESTS